MLYGEGLPIIKAITKADSIGRWLMASSYAQQTVEDCLASAHNKGLPSVLYLVLPTPEELGVETKPREGDAWPVQSSTKHVAPGHPDAWSAN